jgi:CRP-like cAMP-binding protein
MISNGDVCDSVIFVIDGKIEIEVEQDGDSQVIASLKRGDIIGCQGILEGDDYDFSAICMSTVNVFKLPKAYIDDNVNKVQGIKELLMSAISYYEENPNDFYDFIINKHNNKKELRSKTLEIKRLETKNV